MRISLLFLCFLMCCGIVRGYAQLAPLPITQRGINVMAASVENARSALIDNAGLRQPGEDLNRYLRRIALPLLGETPAHYKTRIERYLDLLARSVGATKSHQRIPALRDTCDANRALWERAIRTLQLFPARVAHTQTAWRNAQRTVSQADLFKNTKPNAKATAFASELAQTVSLLIALDDGLRDVKP